MLRKMKKSTHTSGTPCCCDACTSRVDVSRVEGKEIPPVARIICVADSYDAMQSTCCYCPPLEREDIVSELKKGAGTQLSGTGAGRKCSAYRKRLNAFVLWPACNNWRFTLEFPLASLYNYHEYAYAITAQRIRHVLVQHPYM